MAMHSIGKLRSVKRVFLCKKMVYRLYCTSVMLFEVGTMYLSGNIFLTLINSFISDLITYLAIINIH